MIATCENCGTKFNVMDGEIGKSGRFVRCSNCEYEWLIYPKDMQDSTIMEAMHNKDSEHNDDVQNISRLQNK